MWVEITGIPGSGKTTFSRQLREALIASGSPPHSPGSARVGHRVARWLPWETVHNRILEGRLGGGSTELTGIWRELAGVADAVAVSASERRRLRRAVLRQQQIAAIAAPAATRLLVDEGPRQLLLSLWTRTVSTRIHRRLERIQLPWPRYLVIVESDPCRAYERLLDRGRLPYPDRPEDTLPSLLDSATRALRPITAAAPPAVELVLVRNDGDLNGLKRLVVDFANRITEGELRSSSDGATSLHYQEHAV